MDTNPLDTSKRPWDFAFGNEASAQESSLIPVTSCRPQRAARGTRHLRIPRVRVAVTLPDRTRLAVRPVSRRRGTAHGTPATPPRDVQETADAPFGDDDPAMDDDTTQTSQGSSIPDNSQSAANGRHANATGTSSTQTKNFNQCDAWTKIVFPALVPLYLRYLRRLSRPDDGTESLAENDTVPCTCGEITRHIRVTCVYFDGMKLLELDLCSCRSAPVQLLEQGLFACAPLAPSVAVDMRLLQLCRETSVRVSPNVTGWSESVEALLLQRGVHLNAKDGLRKRFGKSLQWYGALDDLVRRRIQDRIDIARTAVIAASPPSSTSSPESNTPPPSSTSSPESNTPPPSSTSSPESNTTPPSSTSSPESNTTPPSPASSPGSGTSPATYFTAPSPTRASSYLWHRCPICFGREFRAVDQRPGEPDVIVCIDGNFTQKRSRKAGNGLMDATLRHPNSVFLAEHIIQDMAARVDRQKASPRARTSASNQPATTSMEDGMEEGMRVPTSVLDSCNESFIAADEKRVKASTEFFSDTGLMALLCRHDRVLWLANMTSAGEKQHYALALVEELFKQLPDTATVGLLYDIGCQLHRSCLKHGFLAEYLDRIQFALAVFHAYGHQWACQVIYHPRKCKGFGWSNGEGCERFWSSIKGLISVLRVSGYHRRLLILDEQIQYFTKHTLYSFGKWLEDHWTECQGHKIEALVTLRDCAVALPVLRDEWSSQVRAQTKPPPKQSRNAGKEAVEAIHVLQTSVKEYQQETATLDEELSVLTSDLTSHDITEKADRLATCRRTVKTLQARIRIKRTALGVDGRLSLDRLATSEYLNVQFKARGWKWQLRDRVRARKYEKERLERSYRNVMNERSERTLSLHTAAAMKRRDPGILALAAKYNNACKTMTKLIAQHEAPRGAIAPCPIDRKKLFDLDVDDNIWQDVGLDDNDEWREHADGTLESFVPRWLGDINVRSGINAMLKLDRCKEEERRLTREMGTLWEWARLQWQAIEVAKAWASEDSDVAFLLDEEMKELERLLNLWREQSPRFSSINPPPSVEYPRLREAVAAIAGGSRTDSSVLDDDVTDPVDAQVMADLLTGLVDDVVSDDGEDLQINDEADLAEEVEDDMYTESYRYNDPLA